MFQQHFTMKKKLCLVRTLHAKNSQTHHFLEQWLRKILFDFPEMEVDIKNPLHNMDVDNILGDDKEVEDLPDAEIAEIE